MTAEQMRITRNESSDLWSRLAHFTVYMLFKNGHFQPVFRTIVLHQGQVC